jgi:hypothetical protein
MTLAANNGVTYLGACASHNVTVTGGVQVATGGNKMIQGNFTFDPTNSRLESLSFDLPWVEEKR